jgi:hypothetical protein
MKVLALNVEPRVLRHEVFSCQQIKKQANHAHTICGKGLNMQFVKINC